MTRKSALPVSLAARQLQQQVSTLVRDYETRLGPVPVWFAEYKPEQALSLIAAFLRIGMRLPSEDAFQVVKGEQLRDRWALRHRGWNI
jgi:hypothetical protein